MAQRARSFQCSRAPLLRSLSTKSALVDNLSVGARSRTLPEGGVIIQSFIPARPYEWREARRCGVTVGSRARTEKFVYQETWQTNDSVRACQPQEQRKVSPGDAQCFVDIFLQAILFEGVAYGE